MAFVNCTPHALNIRGLGVLPASGIVARCATLRVEMLGICIGYQYCGSGDVLPEPRTNECTPVYVRTVIQETGKVEGLPEMDGETVFIVSAMVLDALKGSRPDVYAPDTGADAIRKDGQIVEVLGLVRKPLGFPQEN